jgi:hypothetical protein
VIDRDFSAEIVCNIRTTEGKCGLFCLTVIEQMCISICIYTYIFMCFTDQVPFDS